MNVPGKTRMSELKHVPWDVRSDDVLGGAFMESTRNREYVHRTHGRTSLRPIYTVRFCRIRQAYDRPTSRGRDEVFLRQNGGRTCC